ncbi:glycosyltransferase family 4 protein [Hymenobacter sp. B81]|uniref:glycosyltransferase family 4 protein n=1 Tax=Hymenobacter sp. B81 TaxID=3344878 RepID=UPI0037DCD8B2
MNSVSPPIKVGFLTSTDPLNRRSWSGVHYSMFQASARVLGPTTALGPAPMVWPLRLGDNLNRRLVQPLTGKRYHYAWTGWMARLYARRFAPKIAALQPDVLLAPASFTEIAHLRTSVPIVYCEDSTLGQLIDFYPGLSGLLDYSKRELNELEHRALQAAALVCYSSEWAAESAIRDYGADPRKVVVIPFGANYPQPIAREQALQVPPREECRLFLLGGEWGRKGGAVAYDTMVALNEQGIPARLTVVGCQPPDPARYTHPGFEVIPFLNMGVAADLARLEEIFRRTHFFLLPSRAECAAIAFGDANSFGIPVFTTNVGGISSFVAEGENGFMLPLEAGGADFAAAIARIWHDPARYAQLRQQARERYERVLNWDVWAHRLREVLLERGIVGAARPQTTSSSPA